MTKILRKIEASYKESYGGSLKSYEVKKGGKVYGKVRKVISLGNVGKI